MKYKLISFFLIFIISTILLSSVSLATGEISFYDEDEIVINADREPGPVEKVITEIILSIPKSIMSWLALEDITQLVFMRPTGRAGEQIIFENNLNNLGSYAQIYTTYGLSINPTNTLANVLSGLNIDKNVVFGRDANNFSKELQKKLDQNFLNTRSMTFIQFLTQYVDSEFGKYSIYPRNTLELLTGASGRVYEFPSNLVVEYKNERYTLTAAYVPATMNVFGTKDLSNLGVVIVANYGSTNTTRGYYDSFIYGIFPQEYFGILDSFRNILENYSILALVMVVLFAGFLLLTKSTNHDSLTYAKEIFKGMFFAILLMKFYFYLFQFFAELNIHCVDAFYEWLVPSEEKISFLDMLYNPNTSSIAMVIVTFLAVFMIAMMNFQYTVRMLSLGIIFAFTPVAAVISIIPERRSAIKTWFNELVGNIFTQTIHAAALVFVLKTINAFGQSPALRPKMFWVAMAGLMALNSIAMLVRSLIGLESFNYNSALGFSANMLGLAPLMALGRMTGRAFGKKKEHSSSEGSGAAQASSGEVKSAVSSIAGGSAGGAETTENGLAYKGQTAFQRMLHNAPATAGKALGAVGLGLAGGMIMAGAGQNPVGGIMVGASVGSGVGGRVGERVTDTAETFGAIVKKADAEQTTFSHAAKEYFGYIDPSQKYNAAFMGSIGRKVGGLPGEVAGNIIGGATRVFGYLGNKKAQANTYANDSNIEYMDTLHQNTGELKQHVSAENIRLELLKSNLDVADKRMGDNKYSEDYRNLLEEYKNPGLNQRERSRIKFAMDNMEDKNKYVPEYYSALEATQQQELSLTEAKQKLNSSVSMEMEAKGRVETIRRLKTMRDQYYTTKNNK